jgi:MFS transporter, FHS family, glucose/mannose:H+ symporter
VQVSATSTQMSGFRARTGLLHAAFVLTGVMATLLGPMLPFLSSRWNLNDAQSGRLFTAQFLASLLGVGFATLVARRQRYRPALIVGLTLMAIGAALLARANWALGIAAISIYGIGVGATIPPGNLLIAELNPSRRAAALNLLNFSWGVGAVGSPIVVRVFQNAESFYLYGVGLLLGLSAVSMFWVPVPALPGEEPAAGHTVGSAVVWSSRFIIILGVLFFSYVGTENAIGGWIASYARRMGNGTEHLWTMTPSFFWGALLAGRALAPLLLRRLDETRLSSLGLSLALSGIVVLLAVRSTLLVSFAAMLTGLGLSSIYPAYIATLSHWFGDASVRVGGLMFSLASLGGASLPWLVGVFSTNFQSLRTGLAVPLASTTLMLALSVAYGSYRPIASQPLARAANSQAFS